MTTDTCCVFSLQTPVVYLHYRHEFCILYYRHALCVFLQTRLGSAVRSVVSVVQRPGHSDHCARRSVRQLRYR